VVNVHLHVGIANVDVAGMLDEAMLSHDRRLIRTKIYIVCVCVR
jgi:hypothetical protein